MRSGPPTKIIAIDIDDMMRTFKNVYFSARVSGDLDVYSTMFLQRACEFTGAQIISISSLFNRSVEAHRREFFDLLAEAGLDTVEHIHTDWCARDDDSEARGDILDRWLGDHPEVTHIAALDDENVLRAGEPHPAWVHVQEGKGLLPDHFDKVMHLLNADPGAFFDFCHERPLRFSATPVARKPS